MWISLIIKHWRLAAAALSMAVTLGYIGYLRHEVRSEIARSASCEATIAEVAAQSRTAQEALAAASSDVATARREVDRRFRSYHERVNDANHAEGDTLAPAYLRDVLSLLDGEGGSSSPADSR